MPASRYLKPEDIRRLRNYEFGAKAMVEGYLSGRHRSKQRGSSIEFHEFRQYTQGDDLARIDWRVFARNDRLFLRTFEQETNLECHILLDCSASMDFRGQGSELGKLEYASFFAACLAWLVISKTDRVSLTLFDEGIRDHLPPGSTKRHLNDLLSALEHNRAGSGTSIHETLRRAHPLLRRKGTLVLLSDFFCEPAELFRALNPYFHRGFRIHLFHLLDPAEMDLGNRGLARFTDMENGQRLTVHPQTIRQAWKDQLLEHSRALRELAASRGADYALVPTDQSYFTLFDRLK
ncbi:DUF58 domain-containing protein [Haloferula sargassicola]|uniref:DUF58 domain-containing protein n=1 Tax=Haloferula sargassicola TaxID=490096 RepID=A0ABP9UIF3_9BACT